MTQNIESPYGLSATGVQHLVEQLMTLYAEKYAEREAQEQMIASLQEQVESIYAERQEWDEALKKRDTAIASLVGQIESFYRKQAGDF